MNELRLFYLLFSNYILYAQSFIEHVLSRNARGHLGATGVVVTLPIHSVIYLTLSNSLQLGRWRRHQRHR